MPHCAVLSQIWLLRLSRVDDSNDDPRAGAVDAARARLRRAPRAAELDADKWANVQPGSIYHALRKLAEEGLLREVATEQVGARPARTTYEMTPRARTSSRPAARPTGGSIASRSTRSRRRSPSCPRCRGRRRRRRCATGPGCCAPATRRCAPRAESDWMRKTKPTHVGWMFELWSARAEAEIALVRADRRRGSSPVCRTCPLSWRRARAGRAWQGRPRTPSDATRNNQR